ncbi:hypothetical protein Tco_0776126 [Tanacetum coccineum]
MTTLAEFMIIAGVNNRPPMLEKHMYDSWKSRMELYIENREKGRMILNSAKKYEELSVSEKLQADWDLKATNIVLQGLPPDVYVIVNHHKVSKEIWDRVKLLMQGTKFSLEEKECKLYDEFDKFLFVKGETLYYLPPEWSKFVTDVKLARDLHTTNFDQLYSYLKQHEAHANETRLLRLVVPMFSQGDDPIAYLNKAMAFLLAVAASKFLLTNNQLRTSSNLRNHATIQDDRDGREGLLNVIIVKTEDLDAYNSNCDDVSNAKAVLMANLSNYGSDVISETLKDIFNVFDKDLLNEVTEVQTVFNQMEAAVQQCSVDKQCFEIHKKELFLENDRLLHQIMSQDVMICVMNSTAVFGDSVNLEMKKSESCNKCLDLEAELVKRKNMVERDVYTELSNSFAKLEKHCISLELDIQLNQQIFQKDKSCNNQNALEIPEYFENNDLKAQLQAKDTTIRKLKEHIKSMRENDKEKKVKQEMDETKTINIELKHKHYDSLISQLNSKSMENKDLKGQIQEKVFVTTTLQDQLKRLKGNTVLDNATIITNATTIAPRMFKLDLDPLAPRIQKLLVYVRDTCPNANKPSEKLVAITPMNKVKKVRFPEPLTSSGNIHKQVESSKTPDSNKLVLPSTGLKSSTSASRSQPTGDKKNYRISQTPSSNMKNKVEAQLRRVNIRINKMNHVKDSICDANVRHTMLNVKCSLKLTSANLVPSKETTYHSIETSTPDIKVYSRRPKQVKSIDVPSSSSLVNDSKFLGTVRLKNDQIAKIMGYGEYQLRNVTISRVYYVEGLGHNLFSVGQFYDSDLEVAFQKNTRFIRNLDGVDLLSDLESQTYTQFLLMTC